jgi:hypothetical protein|tara:strand:- start:7887 stop:8135 length:249 start_codon:yes stop_codon:yes gene_type:complete
MTWTLPTTFFFFESSFSPSNPHNSYQPVNPYQTSLSTQEYMKSKNWRVPMRNAVGSSDAQRALAGLIIQSRKDFADEFGEEA